MVFRAEQGYVSPNGYPSKHVHHQQVPTWNYRVVHAHGEIRVREDRKFLLGVVGRLTHARGGRTPNPGPWRKRRATTWDALLGQIVGLEIAITRLEGKFKLSQNKDEADRLGAAEHVAQRGHADLAERMRGR